MRFDTFKRHTSVSGTSVESRISRLIEKSRPAFIVSWADQNVTLRQLHWSIPPHASLAANSPLEVVVVQSRDRSPMAIADLIAGLRYACCGQSLIWIAGLILTFLLVRDFLAWYRLRHIPGPLFNSI